MSFSAVFDRATKATLDHDWVLRISRVFLPSRARETGRSPSLYLENVGPSEADSWLFPVRGLAQRPLAFDLKTSCGANENAAGAGDPFYREAVSAHPPCSFAGAAASPLPPFPSACWKMSSREAGTGGHMRLRGPLLLSES